MKILLITLTALFSVFNTKAATTNVKVDPVVLQSFKQSFETATEVKWSVVRDYYQADFSYNNMYMTAFFDSEGSFVATSRNITSLELPAILQKRLKKEMKGKWITALTEVSDKSGTTYYVSLENANSVVIMTSDYGTGWNIVQRLQKS